MNHQNFNPKLQQKNEYLQIDLLKKAFKISHDYLTYVYSKLEELDPNHMQQFIEKIKQGLILRLKQLDQFSNKRKKNTVRCHECKITIQCPFHQCMCCEDLFVCLNCYQKQQLTNHLHRNHPFAKIQYRTQRIVFKIVKTIDLKEIRAPNSLKPTFTHKYYHSKEKKSKCPTPIIRSGIRSSINEDNHFTNVENKKDDNIDKKGLLNQQEINKNQKIQVQRYNCTVQSQFTQSEIIKSSELVQKIRENNQIKQQSQFKQKQPACEQQKDISKTKKIIRKCIQNQESVVNTKNQQITQKAEEQNCFNQKYQQKSGHIFRLFSTTEKNIQINDQIMIAPFICCKFKNHQNKHDDLKDQAFINELNLSRILLKFQNLHKIWPRFDFSQQQENFCER